MVLRFKGVGCSTHVDMWSVYFAAKACIYYDMEIAACRDYSVLTVPLKYMEYGVCKDLVMILGNSMF